MATKTKNNSSSNFDRLFGSAPNEENGRAIAGLMLLDPRRIETAEQPRTQFDETGLSELANSIRERREKSEGVEGTGILQPLLVSTLETGIYRLVAGERRLRAARRLELPFVPAIVVPDNPRERLISQLVENLQRAGLNPLEEARALDVWIKENGFSVRDAAGAIGKDKNYISNRLRLLKMGDDVQKMVSGRADALIHAQLIEVIKEPEHRQQLLHLVATDGISVAELRRLISPAEIELKESDPSLRRDAGTKNTSAKAVTSNESGSEGKEAKLSLRRDNLASTSNFAGQMETLKAAQMLLAALKSVAEWQPDEKAQLKTEIAVLSQHLQELEQKLAD